MDLLLWGWCLRLGGQGGKGSGPANMSKGVLVEFADGLDVRVGKVKSGGDSKESPSSWPNGGAIC